MDVLGVAGVVDDMVHFGAEGEADDAADGDARRDEEDDEVVVGGTAEVHRAAAGDIASLSGVTSG